MWTLLLVPALIQAQTCNPACVSGGISSTSTHCVACPGYTTCVADNAAYTCQSGSTPPPSCDTTTCNGAVKPTFASSQCWDGSSTQLVCDTGKCGWVVDSCPPNPCSPSPCAATETCCVPNGNSVCGSATPTGTTAPYVCIAKSACVCSGTAPTIATTQCADGTLGGPFCPPTSPCQWQVRQCPTDPCNPNPCTGGQVCELVPPTTLAGTANSATHSCVPDPCSAVTCAGAGKCVGGKCFCDPNAATPTTQTTCLNGVKTPAFNADPTVCAWVDVGCPPPPPPPTCTGTTTTLINAGVDPTCVPPTDPCVSPIVVTCDPGLVCDGSSGSPVCTCDKCPPNRLVNTLCYNGEPTYTCDRTKCQLVPNPNCKPDPCATTKCADNEVCMNMGAGIAAGPVCVPKDPCNPNPCQDASTVCTANPQVATVSASVTAGTNSLVASAPFTCVPKPTATCNPSPCHNGGVCVTGSLASNGGTASAIAGLKCVCQPGWTGAFCDTLVCSDCMSTTSGQCASPNPVLSNTAGSTNVQSCVCADVRYTGPACNIAISGGGTKSPNVSVATADNNGATTSITGPTGVSFTITGGTLPPTVSVSSFAANTIVVEVDRKDDSGNSKPGPLPAGTFAFIEVCSTAFVAGSASPQVSLVDSTGVQDNKGVCAKINPSVSVPVNTWVAPNCWNITLCHASTYAVGSMMSTNGAGSFAVGAMGLSLFLFM